MSKMDEFNLAYNPWIPCDGKELGLYETLVNSHRLKEIRDASPVVTISLYRLAMALACRIFDLKDVKNWERVWKEGRFDEDAVKEYLSEWADEKHRFNLFDDQYPFYQMKSLESYKENLSDVSGQKNYSVMRIIHELPEQNTPLLFDHTSYEDGVVLTPREAAKKVVACQAAGLGGWIKEIKGDKSTPDAPMASGAVFLVQSNTLFEAIMLNLCNPDWFGEVVWDTSRKDSPAWEKDEEWEAHKGVNAKGNIVYPRRPTGLLDWLTWQSRQLLLLKEEGPNGVSYSVQGSGYLLDGISPRDCETMMAFERDKDSWKAVGFSKDRFFWRDFYSVAKSTSSEERGLKTLLFARRVSDRGLVDKPLTVSVIGLSKKQRNVFFWNREDFSLPQELLMDNDVASVLDSTLSMVSKIGEKLEESLRWFLEMSVNPQVKSMKDKKRVPWKVGANNSYSYWANMEPVFRHFAKTISPIPGDDRVDKVLDEARKIALGTFDLVCGDLSSRTMKANALARSYLEDEIGNITKGREG